MLADRTTPEVNVPFVIHIIIVNVIVDVTNTDILVYSRDVLQRCIMSFQQFCQQSLFSGCSNCKKILASSIAANPQAGEAGVSYHMTVPRR